MTLALYRAELLELVHKMYDEGLVDDQFLHVWGTRGTTNSPEDRLLEYCSTVPKLFTQLSLLLEENVVDFKQVEIHARQLFESSTSFGAKHVKHVCSRIVGSCHAFDKDQCTSALTLTKREYTKLRRNLDTLLQIERKIIDFDVGSSRRFRDLNRMRSR